MNWYHYEYVREYESSVSWLIGLGNILVPWFISIFSHFCVGDNSYGYIDSIYSFFLLFKGSRCLVQLAFSSVSIFTSLLRHPTYLADIVIGCLTLISLIGSFGSSAPKL